MHDKIFDIIFKQDEITWKSLIYDLVKEEQMDPWDVDVSLLSKKYIDMLKKLKELDFRVSGKVVLAAGILLRIKSTRLVGQDLSQFDAMLSPDEMDDSETEPLEQDKSKWRKMKPESLIPKIPQPRKRKVSIYELVDALQQALEVNRRRFRVPPTDVKIPEKKVDISEVMKKIYSEIVNFFNRNSKNKLTFTQLVHDETKEGKVLTFIPLLHLTNQRKVDLEQQQHFGEIEVKLIKSNVGKEIVKELAETET
ncbi:segregation/condensation protein A [Candidatus Woesearchaeota archaeon]|nr:segregation/condensation protein A [Candidatus Woesearchaeota archaeon]